MTRTRRLAAALGLLVALVATPLGGCWQQTHAAGPTIIYWHIWSDKFYGALQDRVTYLFDKTNPGFTVKPFRGQGNPGKFLAAVAAGHPPDVFMIQTAPIQLAVQGGLMPLDNYLKASKVIKQADFLTGTWATCTFHGHVYCIPYDYDSFALFWNKDLFKAAGLDPNKPPSTWAELYTYAKKLTTYDKKGNITQLGFAPWIILGTANEWPMWANGGQLWDYKAGKPTMYQPANVAALQWEINWAKEFGGYAKILRFASAYRTGTYYLGQKVAMWVGESYGLSTLQVFEPTIHYGVARFGVPRPDAKHPFIDGDVDGNMMAIPVGSKQPDLAWKFIEWNCTKGIRYWATHEADISARTGDLDILPTYLKEPYRSDYPIFTNLLRLKHVFYNQGSPVDNYYYNELRTEFDLALRGKKTAAQALKDMQSNIQDQLTKALAHYHG
jgi:multiple sugar transport system substrate-binding protein